MTVSHEMDGCASPSQPPREPPSRSDVGLVDSAKSNVPVAWVNQALAGRYRVRDILGQGAMGTVFVAEHIGLSMPVALKVIHPRLATDAAAVARFRREAYLISRIKHANVVSIIDYGLLEQRVPFLVMELIQGVDLWQRMTSREPLPWSAAAAIGSQICDALSSAHAHGIIHRDIKPANIILEQMGRGLEPRVKLLDFGIAKFDQRRYANEDAQANLTPLGVIVGTPGYMAPEQHVGEQVTHRTDLYALGVVLWELTMSQRLFQSGSLVELLSLQMRGAARCRELKQRGAPPAFVELCARLLSYAAIDRPEDAAKVGAELRRLSETSEGSGWETKNAEEVTGERILLSKADEGLPVAQTLAASPASRRSGRGRSLVQGLLKFVLVI